MPEHPILHTRCVVDQALAVLPRWIDGFRLRRLQLVREATTVVLELTAASEAESAGEFIGLAGQFSRIGAGLVERETALFRALQQPRQFAQAETIEDQHGLGAEGFGPPAHQTIRGALDAIAEGLPQIPSAGGEEQIQFADFAVALDDLAGRVACGQRLAGNFDHVVDDDAPCVGVRTLRQGTQCGSGQGHQAASFSRFSPKVMPPGSFFSSSLSCASVVVEILMDTSATFVAGPMPQPSILPIRLSGDVAGFDRGMRGLAVLPSPPKMPSGVGAGGAPGNMSPPGTGGVPPSPPNDPPPLVGAGAGAGGVEPPVAGTAEGSITNTSSRWRPVSESLGRRRRHAVSSSSPGWVCRYSMPRTLMATLPLAHRRRMRSFIVVLPSQAMQSCPAGRGS